MEQHNIRTTFKTIYDAVVELMRGLSNLYDTHLTRGVGLTAEKEQ